MDGLNAPTDARTRILDAAERIVQARGVAGLTLEAAARDAGVSKGGLLYHFASKEALLAALLNRLAAFIGTQFEGNVASQPAGPHRVARAVLAWALGEADCSPGEERHDRAAAVFLAVHHHDPAMLQPVRTVCDRMRDAMLADGTPLGVALTIIAASDGLFMAHIFGMYVLTEPQRLALRATLLRLLDTAP